MHELYHTFSMRPKTIPLHSVWPRQDKRLYACVESCHYCSYSHGLGGIRANQQPGTPIALLQVCPPVCRAAQLSVAVWVRDVGPGC